MIPLSMTEWLSKICRMTGNVRDVNRVKINSTRHKNKKVQRRKQHEDQDFKRQSEKRKYGSYV
jgi:hypothetical protein